MFGFFGIKTRLQAIGNSYSLKGREGKYSIVQGEINLFSYYKMWHLNLRR